MTDHDVVKASEVDAIKVAVGVGHGVKAHDLMMVES